VINVRYFAGARAAAGIEAERVPVPAGSTVQDVLDLLTSRHGERLARVLAAASFLVDGIAVRDKGTLVSDGVELDVLPPFAGG
jgi:molybdopterin synthase sulfur carrier subunit